MAPKKPEPPAPTTAEPPASPEVQVQQRLNGARVHVDKAGTAEKEKTTYLMEAAAGGHLAPVQTLLAQNPGELHATDSDGWTALMFAAAGGHLPCVRELLNAGAEPKTKDKSGMTAAELAERGGHLDVSQFIASPVRGNKKR